MIRKKKYVLMNLVLFYSLILTSERCESTKATTVSAKQKPSGIPEKPPGVFEDILNPLLPSKSVHESQNLNEEGEDSGIENGNNGSSSSATDDTQEQKRVDETIQEEFLTQKRCISALLRERKKIEGFLQECKNKKSELEQQEKKRKARASKNLLNNDKKAINKNTKKRKENSDEEERIDHRLEGYERTLQNLNSDITCNVRSMRELQEKNTSNRLKEKIKAYLSTL